MRMAVAVKKKVRLYERHDGGEAVDEILKGWAVGILREGRDWYQVITHYGYRGFAAKRAFFPVGRTYLQRREAGGEARILIRSQADVLESPHVRAGIVETLLRGSIVLAKGEERNGYQKVELLAQGTGYLPQIALKRRLDNDEFLWKREGQGDFLNQKRNLEAAESDLRGRLERNAKAYLGAQYRWGGKSSEGLDCSGLVFLSYFEEGILIYRDAIPKEGYPIRKIPFQKAKPADLLYFKGHVAMYLGDGKYIHSTGNEKSFGCVINSLKRGEPGYREDLARGLICAGTLFG